MVETLTWHEWFILQAQLVALKSKDRSTKVGCVLVSPDDHSILSHGYNGFPRGISDDVEDRHSRPAKYSWTEHAERNAVYNAARNGVRLKGAIAYLNWEPIPCEDCTRALIQSGITRIIGPDRQFVGKGTGKFYLKDGISYQMLQEAGIVLEIIPFPKDLDAM